MSHAPIALCSYGGQEKLKREGEVLILFVLEGLILEGRSMSWLSFVVV
jgi:hypothetical protein